MNTENDPFAQYVRSRSLDPGENPYFTPRVLNRLPQRRSRKMPFAIAVALLVAVVCAVYWISFYRHSDLDVVTVRDLVNLVCMALITLVGLAGSIGLIFTQR